MNLQRATVEVTGINNFLLSNVEGAIWKLNLSGEFTTTSRSYLGGKPRIEFKGKDIELQDSLVLISLKPLPSNIQSTRVAASEPWHSNDDCRDALRIDGLNEGGYVDSQISIYTDQTAIDYIKNVDLASHRIIIKIQYIDDIKDPRPLPEQSTDHLFAYLTEASIHILSHKDGYYRREHFKLLDEEASTPSVIDKIEPITDLLHKILTNNYDFKKLVKISALVIIILLIANLFRG